MEDSKEKSPPPQQDEAEDEGWVGPLPSEASEVIEPQPKKRKILQHEKLFLDK